MSEPRRQGGEAHKLDTAERVCFYEQEFYVLSNFSAFRVTFDGVDYDTAEHAYQAQKFPGSPELQGVIRLSRSAHEAYKAAEAGVSWRRADWDRVKLDVMRQVIRAKYDQHEYVRRKLRQTGDRELVEDSWRDAFWGIGPNGDGANWLGRLWMELRAEKAS